MELSIIIVNWNVKEFLRKCLKSIYSKTHENSFEVIVVDNASSDSSVDMLMSEFPSVRTIACNENLGFGKGNNLALKYAAGKYICLINPDTELLNNALDLMLVKLRNNHKIGIIGPRLLSADGTIQKLCARKFNILGNSFRSILLAGRRAKPIGKFYETRFYYGCQQVECLSAACVILRREAIEDDQIFDPQFFMYAEDVDFFYNAYHKGWLLFYDGTAEVMHYGGESSKQNLLEVARFEYSAISRLILKHHGKFMSFLYQSMYILSTAAKLMAAWLMLLLPTKHNDSFWISRKNAYARLLRCALEQSY